MLRNINTTEFKEKILDYTKTPQVFLVDKPTIIKFTSDWCGPCKMMNPVLEEVEKEFEGKVDIYNVDIDKEFEPAAAFGIRSIPNMIFIPLEGTGTPERMVGALSKKSVVDAIHRLFKI